MRQKSSEVLNSRHSTPCSLLSARPPLESTKLALLPIQRLTLGPVTFRPGCARMDALTLVLAYAAGRA
jgi:hypothetical protein